MIEYFLFKKFEQSKTTTLFEEPFEKCAICRYNLRGMSTTNRCPECGFSYSPGTKIWITKTPRALSIALFVFLSIFTIWLIYRLWFTLQTLGPTHPRFILHSAWALGSTTMLSVVFWLFRDPTCLLAVNEDGIHSRQHSMRLKTYRWMHIKKVEIGWTPDGPYGLVAHRHGRMGLGIGFPMSQVYKFVETANSSLENSKTESTQAP